MTPAAIVGECEAAIKAGHNAITLVIPKGKSMRLGGGMPRGELLCENHNGDRVVRYNAKRTLEAVLMAMTGVKVTVMSAAINKGEG